MKILLFGKNGQISRRLYGFLLPLGKVIVFGSNDINFKNLNKLRNIINDIQPNIIINASAYTNVDKSEIEKEETFLINTHAVKILAEESLKIRSWLIHYSTDYVFDGTKNTPYTEDDKPNPLNIYGTSKSLADQYVKSIASHYLILRISSVYDSYGKNFPKTILSIARRDNFLRVVNDNFCTPNNAMFIAHTTSLILYKILNSLEPEKFCGIYNLSSAGKISWFDFAKILVTRANSMNSAFSFNIDNLHPVSSSDYPSAVCRPANTIFNTSKLEKIFAIKMPKWDLYIPSFLEEINMMGFI